MAFVKAAVGPITSIEMNCTFLNVFGLGGNGSTSDGLLGEQHLQDGSFLGVSRTAIALTSVDDSEMGSSVLASPLLMRLIRVLERTSHPVQE